MNTQATPDCADCGNPVHAGWDSCPMCGCECIARNDVEDTAWPPGWLVPAAFSASAILQYAGAAATETSALPDVLAATMSTLQAALLWCALVMGVAAVLEYFTGR